MTMAHDRIDPDVWRFAERDHPDSTYRTWRHRYEVATLHESMLDAEDRVRPGLRVAHAAVSASTRRPLGEVTQTCWLYGTRAVGRGGGQ